MPLKTNNVKKILKNKLFLALVVISFVVLIVQFFVTLSVSDSLSYPLILHVDVYNDVDMLGVFTDFWRIFIISFIILIINTVLIFTLFFRYRMLSYVIAFADVIIVILALISTAHIISLNT